MVAGHASITRDVPHFTMVAERDEVIGFDAVRDRARFPVTGQGVVVVPAGFFPPARQAAAPVRQVLSA